MRFSEKYPDDPRDTLRSPCRGPEGVFRSDSDAPCVGCGAPTEWVNIHFEAHFCSEGCLDRTWEELAEAAARPPAPDDHRDGDPGF